MALLPHNIPIMYKVTGKGQFEYVADSLKKVE